MSRLHYLSRATFRLFWSFFRAAWIARRPLAYALDLPQGLTLDPQEERRLKHYFYGSTYLGVVMSCLNNQRHSPSEKRLFIQLSALACSFDDLTEAVHENEVPVVFWQGNPEDFGSVHDKRGLSLHLLDQIYPLLPEKHFEPFRAYMQRVFKVETSGRQKSGNLDKHYLETRTAEKGGASVLLFRSALNHPLTEPEEEALYQFGYLIQFCDDVFDLWHDQQANISTLATHLTAQGKTDLLKKVFEQQVAATHHAFRQTGFATVQEETALHVIHFLVSITRMCLQHYQDLENKYGALPMESRTTIVVDMDKWTSRFRAFRYLLRPLL